MRNRASTRSTILTATLVSVLVACGSESDGASSVVGPTPTEAASATTDPAETTVETTEPPSTEPPTTNSTPDEAPAEADDGAPRAPAPPLEASIELLVEGVEPLGDVPPPGGPPLPPGRYHSHRLGTEVVFSVPETFSLGQHDAGTIVWALDGDRFAFMSRWGETEPMIPDEWIAELFASGWEVVENDASPISGYSVRQFDITPTSTRESIGGVLASGALAFRDGLTHRVWIIDQDDAQPLVIGTGITTDEWSDVVDEVVASLDIGPTIDDPRNGRDPIEYGGFFSTITAGDRYRTLLFGDAIISLPVDATVRVSSQFLSIDAPGDFTGTARPAVHVGAVGQLILPPDDPSAGIFASTLGDPPADAAAYRAFLESLAERGLVSPLREIDETITLLGTTVSAVEFDVPDGGEVGAFVSAPDGWAGFETFTLFPATTYRSWAIDLDDQVAVVIARADSANTDDLGAATDFSRTVANAFETT